MLEQVVQLIGAFLVLGGFAGLQLGKFDVRSVGYLLLNAVGSGLLAIVAIHDREWGFILLESVWTLVAILGLVRLMTNRQPAT